MDHPIQEIDSFKIIREDRISGAVFPVHGPQSCRTSAEMFAKKETARNMPMGDIFAVIPDDVGV